jgi:hypothetical protein
MADNTKPIEQSKFSTFNFTTNPTTNFTQKQDISSNPTSVVNPFNNFSKQNDTNTSSFNNFTNKPNFTSINFSNNNPPINTSFPTFASPIIQQEPVRQLTRQEILEKEITEAVRDLILIFQKCKVRTDDMNNEIERGKMMKIIEVYYESCNNPIVQLVFAELYKGLKKEPYIYKVKYEEMDFDVPDFTYVCFRDYVKEQFTKMQFNINKYY